MRLGVFVFIMLLSMQLSSQEMEHYLVSNGGGISEQPSYQLSFTVGESVVHTLNTNSAFVLNQGFQQSDDILISGIRSLQSYTVQVSVFPNPTIGEVLVNITESPLKEPHVMEVYDVEGSKINIPGSEEVFMGLVGHKLDFGSLSGGVYMVKIRQELTGMEVGSFKVMRAK